MTDRELRALLDLIMCSDPSPIDAESDAVLRDLANREAVGRGYADWIEAFHLLGKS